MHEIEAQGWLLYARLLANPVFMRVRIDAWWMTWLNVVFFNKAKQTGRDRVVGSVMSTTLRCDQVFKC